MWTDRPRNLLVQLQLVKQQPKCVRDIVLPYVQSSAWYGHSENVLQTLLSSADDEERRFGVEQILKLRDGKEKGSSSVRERKTPSLNLDATSVADIISWTDDVHEPVLTCELTTKELKSCLAEPRKVPKWPVHGQSIERVVKEVTKASSKVFGSERRDGYVRAVVNHREMVPIVDSKHDMVLALQKMVKGD